MPVIDLFAGLREVASTRFRNGVSASKMTVEISAPALRVNLNEPELAGAMAQAVADQMRENILGGAKLDGAPATPLAASTIIRREYRMAQGQRGGALSPVRTNKKKRGKGRKNWRKRFRTPRLGEFSPTTSPAPANTRGVESGLLLKSIVAEQNGESWTIYFANSRALTDRTGNSPVGRAFQYTPTGDRSMFQRVVRQPGIRKRMEHVLQSAIGGKNVKPGSLLRELEKTVRLAESLANEAGE